MSGSPPCVASMVTCRVRGGGVWLIALMLSACGVPAGAGLSGDDASISVSDAGGVVDADADAAISPFDADPGTLDADSGSDADAVALADVGQPCDEDEDCITALCVDVVPGEDSEGVCSDVCRTDDDCPREFDCVFLTTSGVDAIRVCLPLDLCIDADGDGYGLGPGCRGADCDDALTQVNVDRDEVCDGIDNDCDGLVDDFVIDDSVDCETGFEGACAAGRTSCSAGTLECVAQAVPEPEVCDRVDNDCDGLIDEDEERDPLSRPCYDGDPTLIGTGRCAEGRQACRDGGYSSCIGQSLPEDETCNGVDDDCDGEIDEGLPQEAYYPDTDVDTYGDAEAEALLACARPPGFVANRRDCDDTDPAVQPDATEIPGDEFDSNCDGSEICFVDSDGDGVRPDTFATVISSDETCDGPGEASADAPTGDCDDSEPLVGPDGVEVCNGTNDDCDARTDEGAMCYRDGEACFEDIDCLSGWCELGTCDTLPTCVEDGTCPPRLSAVSGGGRRAEGRFGLELSIGAPVTVHEVTGSGYGLRIGVGAYLDVE